MNLVSHLIIEKLEFQKFRLGLIKIKKGADLENHYVKMLRELSNKSGMLGTIFSKSQNKIQDPAKLNKLISMLDETNWVSLGTDVKGEIYEGLLERNAEDIKSGAGQYFTPRPLIKAIVKTVHQMQKNNRRPSMWNGWIFLAAYDF